METFVHRPSPVQAIQYTKDCDVQKFRDMLYQNYGLVTRRIGMEVGERVPRYSVPQIKNGAGITILKQGDWIVCHPDNRLELLSDTKFRATYQKATTPA